MARPKKIHTVTIVSDTAPLGVFVNTLLAEQFRRERTAQEGIVGLISEMPVLTATAMRAQQKAAALERLSPEERKLLGLNKPPKRKKAPVTAAVRPEA